MAFSQITLGNRVITQNTALVTILTNSRSRRNMSWKRNLPVCLTDTYNVNEHLWAEKANTAQHFDSFCQKRLVKHWFGELNMSKVTRAIRHVAGTCLASRLPVDNTLTWVHQPVQLWTTTFHRLWIADPSISHRHATLTQQQNIICISNHWQ